MKLSWHLSEPGANPPPPKKKKIKLSWLSWHRHKTIITSSWNYHDTCQDLVQTNVSSSIEHNWTMDIGHHCNALDIMTMNIVPVIRTWRKLSLLIMQEHSYSHLPWLVDLVLFTILYGAAIASLWCHIHIIITIPLVKIVRLYFFSPDTHRSTSTPSDINVTEKTTQYQGWKALSTQVLGSIAKGFRQHGRLVAEYPWPIIIFRFSYNWFNCLLFLLADHHIQAF